MAARETDKTTVLRQSKLNSGRLRKNEASLVVLEGAEIGRDFRLRRKSMLIGRGMETDVRILDDLASREHARITVTWDASRVATVCQLEDLGSTNHTFLNSKKIDRAELKDGDKIQIGGTVLKFVMLDDVESRFHEEVRNRISCDHLTGLLTKESLYLAMGAEIRRCGQYDLPLAVLMMDLDHFKAVNDTHGHQMGSHVLAEVGRLIRESIRTNDVSGRYGGEEFISYLSEAGPAQAMKVAERVRKTIGSNLFTLDDHSIRVTISIGIALFPIHGKTIRSLVGSADRALYRAKGQGRDRVFVQPIG